jgi:hypothetical protein
VIMIFLSCPKCRSSAWTEIQKFRMDRNAGLSPVFSTKLNSCIFVHALLLHFRPRPLYLLKTAPSILALLALYAYSTNNIPLD